MIAIVTVRTVYLIHWGERKKNTVTTPTKTTTNQPNQASDHEDEINETTNNDNNDNSNNKSTPPQAYRTDWWVEDHQHTTPTTTTGRNDHGSRGKKSSSIDSVNESDGVEWWIDPSS